MIRLYAAVIQQRWPYGSKQAVNMFCFICVVWNMWFDVLFRFWSKLNRVPKNTLIKMYSRRFSTLMLLG